MIQIIVDNLLTVDVLIALLVGVCSGIIIGALPGLNANLAAALLLPVSFSMKPVAGLVMLTAVYTSTVYGGSITAILLHTPGTASSAATAIDGYELTKMGRGMEAVGMATISSVVGGTLSALALLAFAAPLASLSLKFGPLEYCLLGIFGLTIIAALSEKDPVKGFIAGAIGLVLSVIGLDPMKGVPRFTFGILALQDGLSSSSVMIGLFSISQMLLLIEDIAKKKTTIVADPKLVTNGRRLPHFKEVVTAVPTMLRSSLIGIIVGIIPAAGAAIGVWLGYSSGKKYSKHPEQYGKGSLEGVAACETCNNAVTGGALIPMMALGIPGSSVTAIILGGFLIHGLNTGYSLFSRNGNMAYSIIIGFLVANLLMGVIGLILAKPVAFLSVVPMRILVPLIICMASLGAYSTKMRVIDLAVILIFGILGYLMRKANFELAPMVLGLILGDIIEGNMRRVPILARGKSVFSYILTRPVGMLLIVLILVTIFIPVIKKVIKKRKEAKT